MGEIDPKDIHTMLRKRLDHFLRIRRRPKCGDDLGAFDVHVVRHAFLHGQDTDCLSRIHDSPRLSGTNEKGHRRLSVVRIWRDWNLLDRDLLAGGFGQVYPCLLYTSDAADDLLCVDLGGRRIIKKKTKKNTINTIYVYNKQHTIHKYN